jgi:enoyl-CoA hydratase
MTETTTGALTHTTDGPVAILTVDDGKANVYGHAVLQAIHAALDDIEADHDVKAVVIAGRPGQFSGGFDLKEFAKGLEQTRDLVIAGGALCNRLLVFPRITVTAVTGNAVAAGAILTLACDWNVGTTAPAKMGLPETAIGMALPRFAIELARARLAPTEFARATLFAEMYAPDGALAAGYLDELTDADQVVTRAVTRAHELSALSAGSVALTKAKARMELHELIASTLVADVTSMTTDLAPAS